MEFIEPVFCKKCGEFFESDRNYIFCPFCGKKQTDISGLCLDKQIEKQVYDWLSKVLQIDEWLVSETVNNQMATVFLLIWPIIELNLFNGDMSHSQMLAVAKEYKEKFPDDELDEIAKHFYCRYQDNNKYQKLVRGYNWRKIEILLTRPYDTIYKENKIAFMIFVVYRYRNNIFHGLKTIDQWNDFSDEIQLCIKFMILLGDCINGIDNE